MKRNDIIRNANREEAEKVMRDIVIELYGGFNQTPAEQTVGQSVKEIMDSVGPTMTGEDVYNILNNAADNTENRQLYPKWFSKQLRTSSQSTNRGQDGDVETSHPAPESTGSYDLDTKINFMTMWAVKFFSDLNNQKYRIGCNWDIQYRFLKKHNMIDEPEGWLNYWKKKAIEEIRMRQLAQGSIRDIIDSRHAVENALQDNSDIMNTIYKLRVLNVLNAFDKDAPQDFYKVSTPDGFSQHFNDATPELPKVNVIWEDGKYSWQPDWFYIRYQDGNTWKEIH